MSRTIRRTKFNRSKHFFKHYWEVFSEEEVNDSSILPSWKYHSDNYYTKSAKVRKQFLKSKTFSQIRQEFRNKSSHLNNEHLDIIMKHRHSYNIKYDLH